MADIKQTMFDIERCICHVPDACRDCSYCGHGEYLDCMEKLLGDALELLKSQPQIVLCKDCKYHGNINEDYCQCLEQETNNDFYCWYGEHK